MPIDSPKQLFMALLSDVREREERMSEIVLEMSEGVKDAQVKEALESRVFLRNQALATLDQCFKLIGEKPTKRTDRLHDIFVEDFRRELAEIKAPPIRHLFVLAKAKQLVHLRIAEYVALTAMADLSGHYGVGVLLETVLAEKLVFVERTRRLIAHLVEKKVEARLAA
jgi:ferritin-like metal-binding protein YciE